MNFLPDFEELLKLLEKHGVDYLAVAFHGYPRFTKDLDLFYSSEKDNVEALQTDDHHSDHSADLLQCGVDRITFHFVANESVEKTNCKFLVESLNFFGMVVAIVVRELSL